MGSAVNNVVGELTGSNAAARGAGRAAMAQERAAKEQQELALKNAESPEELAALRQSLDLQLGAVNKQASLFEALDPAIMEASQQALKLLQGQEAQSLAPLRQQFARDEQALRNQLREQMGPGAETSSAGIQALSELKFRQQQGLASTQQQSLAQLFGMGQSGAQGRGALNQSIGGITDIGSAFGNIANRRVGAITGTSQGVVGSAGSRFTEQTLRGQASSALFNSLIGGAATGAAAGFFGSGADKVAAVKTAVG